MRQAIETKYLGPTNFRGARVKAKCEAGSVTIPWMYALTPDLNHRAAADRLFEAMGWGAEGRYRLVGGSMPNPHRGYAFVMIQSTGLVSDL